MQEFQKYFVSNTYTLKIRCQHHTVELNIMLYHTLSLLHPNQEQEVIDTRFWYNDTIKKSFIPGAKPKIYTVKEIL